MSEQYFYSATLNQLFRDKDTGTPLSGGKIYFYEDSDRITIKPVYKQTGIPGAYTYAIYETNADGSIPINSYGTLDHSLFLYPYDSAGAIELYYLTVASNTGVEQFTREGFPSDLAQSAPSSNGIRAHNYIDNGQFLLHKILAVEGAKALGEVRSEFTDIDGNNFLFHRSSASTAEDFVLFTRFNNYDPTPPSNPRYSINIKCNDEGAGAANKDLLYRFQDVNMFASENGTITQSFWAKADSNAVEVDLFWGKNYGTGGDASTESSIGTVTITTVWTQITKSFTPGENSGKTIGGDDNDYSQLVLRFPTDATFNCELTDFLIYEGTTTNPLFPDENPLETITSVIGIWQPGDMKETASSGDYGWWMIADGRPISRSYYYKLYQVIGTAFGVGDGSTTFNIPDRRGRLSLGSGAGTGLTARTLGQKGGLEEAVAELPAHTHTYYTASSPASTGEGCQGDGQTGAANRARKFQSTPNGEPIDTGSTGSGAGFSIMNPYEVFNVLIFTGDY